MRLGMYWAYAVRSLARGRQRTVLAIFCVTIGVMAIVALLLVSEMIQAGLTDNIRALNGGDLFISSYLPLTPDQLKTFDQLQAQGIITVYTPMHQANATANAGLHVATDSTVLAVDPARFPLDGGVILQAPSNGTLAGALAGNSVAITSDLATTLHVGVGDAIHFVADDGRSATLAVGGLLTHSGYFAASRADIVVALSTYAALPSGGAQPIGYEDVFADVPGHTDANATKAVQAIQAHLPLVAVVTTQETLQANAQAVQNITAFLQVAGLLALLIGGVGIINTMQVSLRRRRTEIAMLKTSGYRQRHLIAMFGLETCLLGIMGGIAGAGIGVALSIFVKSLVERAFLLDLPLIIDPRVVGSGVIIGAVTALIFGLMPIVEASQVRPIAVLRETVEGIGFQSVVTVIGLVLVLCGLFAVLAFGIVQNPFVAVAVVAGAGVFLLLCGLLCAGVIWFVSRLPVRDRLRWWHLPLLAVALLIGVGLLSLSPVFGGLVLGMTALFLVLPLFPKPWGVTVKLALRNVGRQRVRAATTMVALGMGVFGIGLILAISQNLTSELNRALAEGTRFNVVIFAHYDERAAIDQQLSQMSDVTHEQIITVAHVAPLAIHGTPIGQILLQLAAQHYSIEDVLGGLALAQGYDLAHDSVPDHDQIIVKQGQRLGPGDAGTLHAMLPYYTTNPPLSLRLGDQIVLGNALGQKPVTLTITGFYSAPGLPFIGDNVLVDSSVVQGLTGGQPEYLYALHVNSDDVDAALQPVRNAAPAAEVISVADLIAEVSALLNNIVLLLEAMASLSMLAGLIIIANTVTLAMIERRREMGILKSVGYTSRSVLGQVLCENGVAAFLAGSLAMVFVVVAMILLEHFLFNFPGFRGAGVSESIILGLIAAVTAVSLLVAASVAWAATRVRPMEVLRYE